MKRLTGTGALRVLVEEDFDALDDGSDATALTVVPFGYARPSRQGSDLLRSVVAIFGLLGTREMVGARPGCAQDQSPLPIRSISITSVHP